jgi:23S rRNA pseudouridine1911/1915/1917 synthase
MATFSIVPNDSVKFKVCWEDEEIIVIEKPARLVTQPGLGHEEDSLLNGLFAHHGALLQNLGKDRDFGLLHRLDRETSGLLVVALRARAYDALRDKFESRSVRKFYWAVTIAAPREAASVIRKPIAEYEGTGARGRPGKKLARISSNGKPAVTAIRVLNSSNLGAVVECRAVTGRLHQVRVHLASIKCPIVGDGLYGDASAQSIRTRLALHAHRLVFQHPTTGATIDVRSAWPSDLKSVLRILKLSRPDS